MRAINPDVPRDIYHLAQGFYLAGNRAALDIEVGPNLTQSLLSPSVVNFCFSIELFFKALIQKDGTKPLRSHLLQELFEKLDQPTRAEIKKSFENIVPHPAFEEFLKQINDYFQKVRYEYDYPVEIFYEGPIAQFARVVYLHCSKIFKEDSQAPPATL